MNDELKIEFNSIGVVERELCISNDGKRLIIVASNSPEVLDVLEFKTSLFELSESEIRDQLDIPNLNLNESEWYYFAAEIKRRAGG